MCLFSFSGDFSSRPRQPHSSSNSRDAASLQLASPRFNYTTMHLEGKTALITGGAVRLGRAITGALVDRGMNLVIHYRSSADAALALEAELSGKGVDVALVQGDLVSQEACRKVVEEAHTKAGTIEVLVNNAAVFNKNTLMEATEENVMAEFWPNLFAPMFLTRAFAELAGEGNVINMLDRRITSNDTSCAPYLLSKKGLYELTKVAALELAPKIRVNGVAPGVLLPPPGKDEQYLKAHGGYVPLEYPCRPEDIAAAVVYLLEADCHTGQVLYVDGGKHLLGTEHV